MKNERLRKSDDILAVVKSRNRICSNVVNLFYLPNKVNSCRLTVVVSKKISNRAVVRNKIKRQVKAIIHQKKLSMPNTDIVIIVKPDWNLDNFAKNQMILCGLFKRKTGGKS
ncbi:ribonuclease P protein component [Ureaplasma ceti]|uniref:Ribonuclease P protein component n=1 Tax=Ureaplasma ceti TaxID=3119530 RepID=A0ABP9U7M6_9BACT